MNGKYRYSIMKNDPELFLKLPQSLLSDLQRSAKENGRNLNTELIIRLTRTLDKSDILDLEDDMLNMLFLK